MPDSHIDYIIFDRLYDLVADTEDPWGDGFKLSMVEQGNSKFLGIYHHPGMGDGTQPKWPAKRHAARIRALMADPVALNHPMSVDCVCFGAHVTVIPELIDGWHRLFAHKMLGTKKVGIQFSGRIDLLRYLQGKRKHLPEE